MNIKKEILFRVRFAFIFILLVSLGIIYSIFDLQFNESDKWGKKSENINFKYDVIQASRGNILSDDGSILATSLPFYKLAFDPSIPEEEIFDFGIDSLSYNLSLFFQDKFITKKFSITRIPLSLYRYRKHQNNRSKNSKLVKKFSKKVRS